MTIDPCEMEVEPDAVDTLPPQITKGMVVRLKSGGPNMTVSQTPLHRNESVDCMWFVGTTFYYAAFYEDCLDIIEKDHIEILVAHAMRELEKRG